MVETTEYDAIFGVEPEGFITGSSLAYNLGKAFVPVRKQGKLPATTVRIETGEGPLEVHEDALVPGKNVLLVGVCSRKMDAVEQALSSRGMHVTKQCE